MFKKKKPSRFETASVNLCFQQHYIAVDRLITPNRSAIIAITSKMWIRLPTDVRNTPIAHPIIRMTAMIYKSEFIILCFN
jgi:hypothetical protein